MGRLPLMARWPGKITPGTESQALLAQTDLAPTILDIADCEIPADMHLDTIWITRLYHARLSGAHSRRGTRKYQQV